MLTLGSVCSGIGGYDLGFVYAGWRIAWQIECDRYKRDVLTRHWPGTALYGDLFAIAPATLPAVDCLLAEYGEHTFCQPHPLLDATLQLASVTRPRFLCIASLPAICTRDEGADLVALRTKIESGGYRSLTFQMSSSHARLWIVRQFVLGFTGELPFALKAPRTHFSFDGAAEDRQVEEMDYGSADTGTIDQAEAEYGFPVGWTDVPGCSDIHRRTGIIESAPPVFGKWLATMLGEAIHADL